MVPMRDDIERNVDQDVEWFKSEEDTNLHEPR
jgi:hypothetical protein